MIGYLVELLVEAEADDGREASHPEHRVGEVENFPRSFRRVGLGMCQPMLCMRTEKQHSEVLP